MSYSFYTCPRCGGEFPIYSDPKGFMGTCPNCNYTVIQGDYDGPLEETYHNNGLSIAFMVHSSTKVHYRLGKSLVKLPESFYEIPVRFPVFPRSEGKANHQLRCKAGMFVMDVLTSRMWSKGLVAHTVLHSDVNDGWETIYMTLETEDGEVPCINDAIKAVKEVKSEMDLNAILIKPL